MSTASDRGAVDGRPAVVDPRLPPLPDRGTLRLRAHAVADRIDTAALQLGEALVRRPHVVAADGGLAVVFRYGALVTVQVGEAEEARLLAALATAAVGPYAVREHEGLEVLVDPEAVEERIDEHGRLVLREADLPRLQVVAEALSKSTLLAHHEVRMADAFDRIEPLAERLRRGRPPAREAPLLAQLGEVLLNQVRTTGRVEVSEKPEILWERPDLDRLWERLAVEYELVERERALSRKLELATDIAGTLVELLMARRTLRVEWYIVILIVFEIVLVLFEVI